MTWQSTSMMLYLCEWADAAESRPQSTKAAPFLSLIWIGLHGAMHRDWDFEQGF